MNNDPLTITTRQNAKRESISVAERATPIQVFKRPTSKMSRFFYLLAGLIGLGAIAALYVRVA